MSRFSPLCLTLTVLFSLSANAGGPVDPRLKWICDPTGNPDLVRLEIRETDLSGQLYFREVYQGEEIYDHQEYYFDWLSIHKNKMPTISLGRKVERLEIPGHQPLWSIGGNPADCVDAYEYKGKLPNADSPEHLVAECEAPFSDLVKVQILEQADLTGSYYIVEHFSDAKTKTIYDFFGIDTLKPEDKKTVLEKEKFAFPALTPWNGYTRTLHRASENSWYMQIVDECSRSSMSISCKFYMY